MKLLKGVWYVAYNSNAKDTNMLVFFAIGNAKVQSFALGNAKLPDASSFASQWNIGFTMDENEV